MKDVIIVAIDEEQWKLGLARYCRLCAALGLDHDDNNIYVELCHEFGVVFKDLRSDSFYLALGEVKYAWMDSPSILALYKVMQVRRGLRGL